MSTYLTIRWVNGQLIFLPVSTQPTLLPVSVGNIAYNGTNYTSGTSLSTSPNILSGTATTNGINYNVFAFGSTSYSYTVNYSCPTSFVMFVLAVGGGGAGGSIGSGGGGGGGVVMNPVYLPAGSGTITVTVGAGGAPAGSGSTAQPGSGGNTTVTFSAKSSANITAWGGGYGGVWTTYNGGNGGSGGGGGGNTYITGGTPNSVNNNFGNQGGIGINYVAGATAGGGGGGAGIAGANATSNTNNNGGNGIQCFLPGIKDFSPNGVAYGTYYWAGGGGGSAWSNPGNVNTYGGLGGGGGGSAEYGSTTGNMSGGGSALNPGGAGKLSDTGAGSGGTNTGGGGGGTWNSNIGGSGGSGIVILSFPSVAITTSKAAAAPTAGNDILSQISATSYSNISGAFGCKLLNYNYFGPVMTLRSSADTNSLSTMNFYADVYGNLGTGYLGTGTSLASWLTSQGGNTTYAYITKLYDQGMDTNFNSGTMYTTTSQPIYDVANKVINFGWTGSGGVAAPQANCYLSLNNGAVPYNTYYTLCLKHWNASSSGGFLGTGNNGSSNQVNSFRLNGTSGYVNYWWGNDFTTSAGYAANNIITWVASNATTNPTTTTGSVTSSTSIVTTLYLNGTSNANATRSGWSCGNGNSTIGRTTNNEYMNGQIYYMYYFNAGISDADRAILEAT